jgi:hypothetical protein
MKSTLIAAALFAAVAGAQAQNVAIVNGKPVPKARADALAALDHFITDALPLFASPATPACLPTRHSDHARCRELRSARA